MDTTSIGHPEHRSWNYTLVGWGHDEVTWRKFVTVLRFVGYDHVLLVEMECEYVEIEEGLKKSVEFLKPILLQRPSGTKWWEVAGPGWAGPAA